MQFFRKKTKSSSRVGLVVQADQLALAHMEIRDGDPYLLHGRQLPLASARDAEKVLGGLVKELDIEGKQVSYVLSPNDYNLHLVEAPNVEPEELRAAVRWKIKDLLDMKVDEAAIDVFPVPEDAYRGRKMVYVVAALKSRVRHIVEMLNHAGLELAVIDIPELAMHNIARRYIDDSNGVAFMDLRRSGSTMNISTDGVLYLTRRINTQLEPDVMQSEEWSSLKDRLVLEIQRSLDYYESQMGRSQITRIVIAQRQNDSAELTRELNELLSANVSTLNLADHIQGDESLTTGFQQIAWSALGATMRGLDKKKETAAEAESGQEAA